MAGNGRKGYDMTKKRKIKKHNKSTIKTEKINKNIEDTKVEVSEVGSIADKTPKKSSKVKETKVTKKINIKRYLNKQIIVKAVCFLLIGLTLLGFIMPVLELLHVH